MRPERTLDYIVTFRLRGVPKRRSSATVAGRFISSVPVVGGPKKLVRSNSNLSWMISVARIRTGFFGEPQKNMIFVKSPAQLVDDSSGCFRNICSCIRINK